NLIKIGKSTNVEKRIDSIQVACPHELRVVVVWDGDRERRLHTQLNDYRVGGEWFRLTDEVRAALYAEEGQ
ncbi:MAG: GIY-YIG nuclease family protein, partial [Polyangiaceae bacterium]|nr:GIY-YIG nuclease family protein [Polyangiaceae bacterium]